MAVFCCRNEQRTDAAGSPNGAVDSGRMDTSSKTTEAPAQPRALYYGKTATGRGWLVYLDFQRGEGVRYAPRNYGLCDVRRDSLGTVSWFLTVRGDTERFVGTPTPTGLNGVVTLTRGSTGRMRRDDVTLKQALLPPNASADTVSDIFANVNYIEQAGDLTGAEIVILRFGTDSLVLLTMYEGTPDGPWAMRDVTWAGDSLRGSYGVSAFRIQLIRDKEGLRGPWGVVLKKQREGLSDLLLARRHTACGDGR